MFDAATWAAELAWSHWTNVRSGANLFNARRLRALLPTAHRRTTSGTAARPGTTSASALALHARPGSRCCPGVDLSAPLTYAVGLSGNAATVFGGNQGLGNYSVGLGADVLPEVPLRPEVHRLRRPLPRQRHRRHLAATASPPFLTRPRLRQPDLQDHLLRSTDHEPSNSHCCSPRLRRRDGDRRRHAGVSADEAKALGTTLTADRRREGRQQGRHHPRLHRRPDHARRPASRPATASARTRSPARSRACRSTPRTWRSTPTS